ncbi:MAG: hypothetical protein U0P45_00210 [Acidimicrobiales bacterium]
MTLTDVTVLAAAGYFAVFGTGFVFRPGLVERFALRWTDAAGRTEVRCYYGAVSWALAGFLAYLVAQDLGTEALTGVVLLASAVFLTRVVGTLVDGGRSHPYTRLAIPTEAAFVLVTLGVRLLA